MTTRRDNHAPSRHNRPALPVKFVFYFISQILKEFSNGCKNHAQWQPRR
nr:MAG TPA: hypothetical protein [Inoviridae sp.]